MKLTQKEIDVLTIMDDVAVKGFLEHAKKYVQYPEKEVKEIAQKLVNQGLVRIVGIPKGSEEVEWYYHTEKVKPEMLNDKLRYKRDTEENRY
jgi:hypothetical protein